MIRSFNAARMSGVFVLMLRAVWFLLFDSRLYGGSFSVAMHWQAT